MDQQKKENLDTTPDENMDTEQDNALSDEALNDITGGALSANSPRNPLMGPSIPVDPSKM